VFFFLVRGGATFNSRVQEPWLFVYPCLLLRCSLQGMEKKEDELKLGFTLDALNGPNPFATLATVHQDVADALQWLADRSPQQVGKQREQIMKKLEAEAKSLWYVFIFCFSGTHKLYCAL
jgi:hypothetical protein